MFEYSIKDLEQRIGIVKEHIRNACTLIQFIKFKELDFLNNLLCLTKNRTKDI